MGKYCVANGCNNTSARQYKKLGVTFHSFPHKHPDILQIWVHQIKRENFTPTIYSFLCSEHFNESDFEYQPFTGMRMIREGAIPTKRLDPEPQPNHIETPSDTQGNIVDDTDQIERNSGNNDVKTELPHENKTSDILLAYNEKPEISSLISAFVESEEKSRCDQINKEDTGKICDQWIPQFASEPMESPRKKKRKGNGVVNGFGTTPAVNEGSPVENGEVNVELSSNSDTQMKEIIAHQSLKHNESTDDNPQFRSIMNDRVDKVQKRSRAPKEKPHTCPRCGMTFSLKSNLLIHFESHFEEQVSQYDSTSGIAGSSQISDTQLNTEKNVENDSAHRDAQTHPQCLHTEGQLNVIPPLGYAFSERSGMKAKETSFVCSECGKAFYSKGNLERHMRVHNILTPYVCSLCAKTFKNSSSLRNHIKIVHIAESSIHKCSLCNETFSDISNLTKHKRFHTEEKTKMTCSVCGKVFYYESVLRVHIRTHTGEKPYKCSECGKAFCEKSNLKVHTRTHTGEKPYACLKCGKTFAVSSSLRRHEQSHTIKTPLEPLTG